jgi:catechol 2,3-dioxygenase-like lactoylglutathione lyase family enzyme
MAQFTPDVSPLWPARLDHFRINSPQAAALADFYERALFMAKTPLGSGTYLLEGAERRFIVATGAARDQRYIAFALADEAQLARYRRHVLARGAALLPSPTPLFAETAFAVRDPDGRLAVFGAARRQDAAGRCLPGRLQHAVVATSRLPEMTAFYCDVLGFVLSDTVHPVDAAGGLAEPNVCFFRADEEHHCFAAFRAPQSGSDHCAFEVPGWHEMKLWADHFAALEVGIWWGPGRHGAGNNLFFMVKDPDGNNLEISAELERMAPGQAGKRWPAGDKAYNLWGKAWIRDVASAD